MSLLLCTCSIKLDPLVNMGNSKTTTIREVCQTPLLLVGCDEDFVRAE